MEENALEGLLDPYEIQAFHESPIAPLYPRLRRGIFHRMSVESYRKVMEDGFIRPNDGTIKPTYSQSKSSYGGKRKYISVFDFKQVTDANFALHQSFHGCGWGAFFTHFEPVTVVLALDREALAAKLIPNSACWQSGAGNEFCMPWVEAWYPESIPVSAITSRIIIATPHPETGQSEYIEVLDGHKEFDRAVQSLTEKFANYPHVLSALEKYVASLTPEERQSLLEEANRSVELATTPDLR